MRWALAQLRKLQMPYSFEEDMNLENELVGFEDILAVKQAKVSGVIEDIANDRYLVRMNIQAKLVLESAISLKPLDFKITTSVEEVYAQSLQYEDEDVSLIECQTLDTTDAVVTQILCEKPMRSIIEGEEFISDYEEDQEEEEYINPAFASLKNLLK